MNGIITKAAAFICALSLTPALVPAGAAEWINLSDWAYTEVSGFVSDGLLTERLKSESDYTRAVTRGEFAELLYAMLIETGRIAESRYFELFDDCADYPDVNRLFSSIGTYGVDTDDGFRPEQPLLRREAAVMLYSAMSSTGMAAAGLRAHVVFAVNFNDKTDVYDADSGEMLNA